MDLSSFTFKIVSLRIFHAMCKERDRHLAVLQFIVEEICISVFSLEYFSYSCKYCCASMRANLILLNIFETDRLMCVKIQTKREKLLI